ncbi:desulfoferrodoxin [Lachnospiraceae bacterium]|jgi:superoxide reductase|nr:desulfoferrodoxin [Lachnospiraceae bacterium]
MEPVFLKNGEEILYLVSGKKDRLAGCKCEGFSILDSTTSEGAGEKHIPVVEKSGSKITVKVGSVFHPMTQEHSITWIFLETKRGGQFVMLDPDSQPVGEFLLADGDKAVAAYAYCNLHGFWKTDIA